MDIVVKNTLKRLSKSRFSVSGHFFRCHLSLLDLYLLKPKLKAKSYLQILWHRVLHICSNQEKKMK